MHPRVPTVVLTDHAWPDVDVERGLLEAAGHTLVAPFATASQPEVEQLVERTQPAAILTCWAPVSEAAIASSPGLRIVARLGVGLDNIAVAEATHRGIWVTNVPDYCVEEVSDHAVALALSLLRGIAPLDREVRAGTWNPSGARLQRVSRLTAGIIGYGRIGHRTAEKLTGLGMRVVALRPRTSSPRPSPAEVVDLRRLLEVADVILLHVPLNPETQHLVDGDFLRQVRPGAIIVNVSRGGVVDTAALRDALHHGHVCGAALDVVEGEPNPPADLLAFPNVVLTPHVAFSSVVSITELRTRATEEVVRVLDGRAPVQACNQPQTVGV
jgi:D-3-phosphoglycerate dehydrogenase / 2-oxoglutarate reductase